jgi:hypothetical protein
MYMDKKYFANFNEFDDKKKSLIFITGLNIKIDDYKQIYEKYIDLMNVITIEIDENIIENYDDNVENTVENIQNLNQNEIYFISHSFGCLFLYDISIKLNNFQKMVVLMEPTSFESINNINSNTKLSNQTKEFLINRINLNENLKYNVLNQKNLLIINIQIEQLKRQINGVNKIKENDFGNYEDFEKIFCNYNTIKRLKDFKRCYDNNNTHYVVLPIDESNSRFVPHFIYAHVPNKIILHCNLFFGIKNGGKKRKTKHKRKHKTITKRKH